VSRSRMRKKKGRSALKTTGCSSLVAQYMTVHYDYVENIGALSAHVITTSKGRSVTTWAQVDGRWHPEAGIRERIEMGQDANGNTIIRLVNCKALISSGGNPRHGQGSMRRPSEKCCRRSSKNLLTLLPMLRELPGAPIHFYVCSIMAPSCWTLHSTFII
jgi:hypothetical protein